jgi:hypothetical protein
MRHVLTRGPGVGGLAGPRSTALHPWAAQARFLRCRPAAEVARPTWAADAGEAAAWSGKHDPRQSRRTAGRNDTRIVAANLARTSPGSVVALRVPGGYVGWHVIVPLRDSEQTALPKGQFMSTYQWHKLTARQQDTARRIRDELAEQHGIGASVSQVGKHFDDAMAWKRGQLPLEDFTRIVSGVPVAGQSR